MFSKIFIPIQSKDDDQFVFEKALTFAKEAHARIMLIHVFSPDDEYYPVMPKPGIYNYPLVTDDFMKGYRDKWEEAENRGLEMLKSLANQASDAGVTAEFTQNMGNRGRVICDMAKSWEADLIVIRQPAHSKLGELLAGSVSNYVIHHAPCPVLTIPEPE